MDLSPSALLASILSLVTIGFCLIQKIPQIKTLYNAKSTRGISATSLYLELFSYSIMMSYNYCNQYFFLSYMEYPILLFQEYILIYLVLKYRKQLDSTAYKYAGAYFFALSMFLTKIIPTFVLAMLVPFCTPIGATSKIIQLYEIIRTKNANSINLTTWFISAFTNLTRIYTVMIESGDRMLLANFSISFFLSASIWLAAKYYKKPKMITLPTPSPSRFKEHFFAANISDVTYKYKILRMKDTIYVYVGEGDNEVFNEMAVAMPVTNNEIVSTRIIGADVGCDSQEMAKIFAKKLKKQVFFSCNVDSDKMIRPALAKHLSDEIKRHPEAFT